MKEMIDTVKSLRGMVSEPVRSLVAHKIAEMVTNQIKAEDYAAWVSKGIPSFMSACGVSVPPAVARDDLAVEPTALALLVNKWAAIGQYKDGEDFVDFTQPMVGLRDAILEDIRFGCQLGPESGVVIILTAEEAKSVMYAVEGAWEPNDLTEKLMKQVEEQI